MHYLIRVGVSVILCVLAVPAAAAAVPPLNDNYLASTSISDSERPLGSAFADVVDTSEATTQTDIFNPDRSGLPLGGAGPEVTACGATSYGRTAWWDFRPQRAGEVQLGFGATFDAVVAVYEWSETTSKITRQVTCQNDTAGGEALTLPVRAGRNYTVQVGGATGAGGLVQFNLNYFPEPPPPPLLRLASARLRVASALRDRYPSAFRGHRRFTRSCYRISRHKVGCSVRWEKGLFRYTGTVWFRNDVDPPLIDWTDARVTRKRIHRKPPRRAPAPAPAPSPPPSRSCDPNYSGCLDPNAYDYDCLGGSGDGPRYTGPVRVLGDDHFDLDRDGDGIACDDS